MGIGDWGLGFGGWGGWGEPPTPQHHTPTPHTPTPQYFLKKKNIFYIILFF